MAGPCWNSPSPRIRLKPDAVKPGSQLDLFHHFRPVNLESGELPLPFPTPAIPTVKPEPSPERRPAPAGVVAADDIVLELGTVRVWYVPHEQARRYRLTLRADGSARCTVPRRGSLRQARRFVEDARAWLAQQLQRRASRPRPNPYWRAGTLIWFRGVQVPLEVDRDSDGTPTQLRLADFTVKIPPHRRPAAFDATTGEDFRPVVETALRHLAKGELLQRSEQLAGAAGITGTRFAVRNQRTRWGSCSRKGAISLNWRLIQTPDFVRDYIILHELAHRRHLNHSSHFWDEVARLCPEWEKAEAWIKRQGRELL